MLKEICSKCSIFFTLDKQSLPYAPVVTLSGNIIQNRNLYTSNTVAKAYILLAQVASNRGDVARAFQFATDGLSLPGIDANIQMQLRVKLAAGYYIKGKYLQVLAIAEKILLQANSQVNLQFRLLAIAYKSMAYALLSNHEKAFENLRELQNYLNQNDQYSDHIELLEILAIAYFNLGDYSAAVTIQQKLLNLRLSLSGDKLLEQTYYNLATSYYQMNKLDDAYHAFWQANQLAEKNNLPIRVAYAKLGLGKILLQQQEFQQAYQVLSSSVELFQGQNLTKPYLSALTAYAKTSIITGNKKQGYELLNQALLLSENIQLSYEQVELYLLLAKMFKETKNYALSIEYLEKYIEANQSHVSRQTINQQAINHAKQQGNRSRRIALEMAEKSELSVDYDKRFKQQQQWINLLIGLLFSCLIAFIWRWFRNRANKLSQDYDEAEKPKHFLPNSTKTKIWYQKAYKMARKYDYPLAIGYMVIENWDKLPGRYQEKTINEVF